MLGNANTKTLGTGSKPARRIEIVNDLKVTAKGGTGLFIEGYANTKNKPDRYGDIPCVFSGRRGYVYDTTHFLENPVLLLDHENKVENIAGSVTEIFEDDKGLYFRARFSESESEPVKHARKVYAEGHAKAVSIAGVFHYEDAGDQNKLTLAQIYEISLVAVGADPRALVSAGGKRFSLEKAKTALERWIAELKQR